VLTETSADEAGETRKTVTVMFCDVVSSTELGERLDAESLRRVLARYFSTMKTVIERYGGTLEKFIGDAVLAVFGVPVVHEDDALRAARSAWEMKAALVPLNDTLARDFGTTLELRIGIDTGEVVTGTEERLVTGDTVNVAARLQQAANPGEILIGERTLLLAHKGVDVAPVEALILKGKSEAVRAYRLVATRADADIAWRLEAPIVGRRADLSRLKTAFQTVIRDRSCRVFTVVGAAGVGKSRLVRAFLASLDGARVLSGRCLPYGEGITYWPLVEAVMSLTDRLDALALDAGAVATLDGLLHGGTATSREEIAWAFRKLVEAAAVERPVVLLFDDIQWGEPTFLELVDDLPRVSREAPVLVLCIARPDLLEKHSRWTVDLRLRPLPSSDARRLLTQCLGGTSISPDVNVRILKAAAGNPLFLEETTAMVQASGGQEIVVPPSIQALLAARLDQLEPPQRRVLMRAAIEGEIFHRGAVEALLPHERDVRRILTTLARKEILVPQPPQIPGEESLRFRHLMLRDAVYASMPKSVRAELHERFVDWLEGRAQHLPEADAILGYHLEQAYRYRAVLGPVDSHGIELGIRAGERLASAGNRALARGDTTAAISLMERAAALVPPGEGSRRALLARIGAALRIHREMPRALRVLDEVIASAAETGDRAVELRARMERGRVRITTEPEEGFAEVRREAGMAISELQPLEDDEGLAKAWRAVAEVHVLSFRFGAAAEALERSTNHARRAGDTSQVLENEMETVMALILGPSPASEMARIAERLRSAYPTPRREAARLNLAAWADVLKGRVDEAEELLSQSQRLLEPLGLPEELGITSQLSCMAHLMLGNPAEAEREARRIYDVQTRAGALAYASTDAGNLALALYELGRFEDAQRFAEVSRTIASLDDISAQSLWRQALAKILARRGESSEALRLALEAVTLLEPSDALSLRGDALVDLANVLELVGQVDASVEPLHRAQALYEQKENAVSARKVHARLQALAAPDGL
jgi:class 3 adenylate cyclase/tetratricopeptide (TPR) repeat protein